MVRKLGFAACIGIALAFGSTAAHAGGIGSWGPRVGVSIDPDQFVFGGQLNFTDVAPHVTINPNIELGFGDDATVIALNGDGLYHFDIDNSDWSPYAGAGIGINFWSVDVPGGGDNSDTEIGLNIIVGAAVPTKSGSEFFGELRFGAGDIPDLKVMVGWNFAR